MKLKSNLNTIFVADDDSIFLYKLNKLFGMMGYKILTADTLGRSAEMLSNEKIDIVFINISILGNSWKRMINNIRRIDSVVAVFVLTDHEHIDLAAEATHHGADEILVKPIEMKTMLTKTEDVLKNVGK